MRLPSDAQAAVLSCVDEHAHRDEQVYAGFDRDGGAFAALYVERTSDEVSEGAKPPAVLGGSSETRRASAHAGIVAGPGSSYPEIGRSLPQGGDR